MVSHSNGHPDEEEEEKPVLSILSSPHTTPITYMLHGYFYAHFILRVRHWRLKDGSQQDAPGIRRPRPQAVPRCHDHLGCLWVHGKVDGWRVTLSLIGGNLYSCDK